ncbi:MAG TPA: fasciclin domain-containing protein [Actinocrinis sp.]|nr:fasciclin domain-containing protein [Actinocrinis sp.]
MARTSPKSAAALLAALALCGSLCACSGPGGAGAAAASAPAAAVPAGSPAPALSPAAGPAGPPDDFGSVCTAVPRSGAGSFGAMVSAPVATAAEGNPVLATLDAAVRAAGLVDTLDDAPGVTVFAPDNAAFAKIPPALLDGAMANQPAMTRILMYHVVPGRLSPDQLDGTHTTLEGGTITVAGAGDRFTVTGAGTGDTANVVCGNVQTANATIYIIDSVLTPQE